MMLRKKNGRKTKLISLDAEFSVEQHMQNPLKSDSEKIFYNFLKFLVFLS